MGERVMPFGVHVTFPSESRRKVVDRRGRVEETSCAGRGGVREK
jgi:hypothetical protein